MMMIMVIMIMMRIINNDSNTCNDSNNGKTHLISTGMPADARYPLGTPQPTSGGQLSLAV